MMAAHYCYRLQLCSGLRYSSSISRAYGVTVSTKDFESFSQGSNPCRPTTFIFASLAQLAEHLTCNEKVISSMLIGGSIFLEGAELGCSNGLENRGGVHSVNGSMPSPSAIFNGSMVKWYHSGLLIRQFRVRAPVGPPI